MAAVGTRTSVTWFFSRVAEDATHIVYKPGTHGSALTIDSQCTTDPAMDEPTG